MKDVTKKIEALGFSTYEAKVFWVLYQGFSMSAADVAKEAKIPRPSVYEILRSFAHKGICNEVKTPTKLLYEMVDTDVIQDKIENDIYKTYTTKQRDLKECFTEIKPLYKSKRPPEYRVDVELIKGYNTHRQYKFLDLIKNSKQAILLMNRFEGNVSPDLDEEGKRFYSRGGKFKSIYETSSNFKIKINDRWQNVTRESLISLCESFEKQGEEIKLLDNVPQIMAVFDQKIVYFRLFDESIPKSERSDIIIKNKKFAEFITNLFNLYWDKADTLENFKKILTK
ncbi:MAG: helix-turn-helix domain-containing protein [Ignavibacteria bacterium]|jgi:sugar-specific transcriptional regulator TrmB